MRRATTGFLICVSLLSPLLTQNQAAEGLARTLAESLASNELELVETAPADSSVIIRALDHPQSGFPSRWTLPDVDVPSFMSLARATAFESAAESPTFRLRSGRSLIKDLNRFRC